ncbi:glycosyltransferase family 4 protein [Halospina sp. K52047b]|uniref:glycosyltransferase family 4 protein n=1 Tax=Halospina sp. K52047b TaxID=2614160 RepID=UPI00124AD72E|nr:glycosyltransferase family 4 protein [Halospina sp. K52047b]KAA8981909.1 glycosyltransferase family 4 protein [Halospina sp. K52047b]
MSCGLVLLTSNTSWYLYNFRRSTIRALNEAGYRVLCLAPRDEFSARLAELGAEYEPLPLDGKAVGPVGEVRSLMAIRRVVRRFQPVFVFNFTVKMNIYAGLVCAWAGIPFANNISGLGTAFIHDNWLFRRVRQVYGMVNRRAERLFFQNSEDQAVFRRYGLMGDVPTTLLPGSGVDLAHFEQAPMSESGPLAFLLIGRLLGDKGIREYADACRQLKGEGVPARCLLLGQLGVSNRTAIERAEVEAWEREGILEYLGETDDVRPILREAHVLVLPSYREGMPRTVLEAAAMGRPAIVTDVPGCREAIEPGVTGWLCEVRDSASLAARMRECCERPASELADFGVLARERMEARFSESIVVNAYLECLGVS